MYGIDHAYNMINGVYKAIWHTKDAFNLVIAFCTFAHIMPKASLSVNFC